MIPVFEIPSSLCPFSNIGTNTDLSTDVREVLVDMLYLIGSNRQEGMNFILRTQFLPLMMQSPKTFYAAMYVDYSVFFWYCHMHNVAKALSASSWSSGWRNNDSDYLQGTSMRALSLPL